MKIPIDLSKPKTVLKAIQALKRAENTLVNKVVEEMAKECYEAIKERANKNLSLVETGIGAGLIADIKAGWDFIKVKDKYVMFNRHDKAHYIEFGVGATAQQDPHPNATQATYEYDIPGKKLTDRSWIFRIVDMNTVDIGEQYVMTRPNGEKIYQKGKTVRTKGQPATMYLYNAFISFVESEEPQKIWSKVSLKYFGDWVKP